MYLNKFTTACENLALFESQLSTTSFTWNFPSFLKLTLNVHTYFRFILLLRERTTSVDTNARPGQVPFSCNSGKLPSIRCFAREWKCVHKIRILRHFSCLILVFRHSEHNLLIKLNYINIWSTMISCLRGILLFVIAFKVCLCKYPLNTTNLKTKKIY